VPHTPDRPVDIASLFSELAGQERTTVRLHPRPGLPSRTARSAGHFCGRPTSPGRTATIRGTPRLHRWLPSPSCMRAMCRAYRPHPEPTSARCCGVRRGITSPTSCRVSRCAGEVLGWSPGGAATSRPHRRPTRSPPTRTSSPALFGIARADDRLPRLVGGQRGTAPTHRGVGTGLWLDLRIPPGCSARYEGRRLARVDAGPGMADLPTRSPNGPPAHHRQLGVRRRVSDHLEAAGPGGGRCRSHAGRRRRRLHLHLCHVQ
jgi:hypothetical protein